MASIVVAGDTSGTVTLTAPLVAGTTTLTLPTTSGTVLTSASSIPTSQLTGSVTRSQLPSGSVLQVVNNSIETNGNYFSTSSSSFVSTNFSVSISPTSATSRILLMVNAIVDLGANNSAVAATIFRGSTNLAGSGGNLYSYYIGINSAGIANGTLTMQFFDSPATTASTTYTVFVRSSGGGGTISFGAVGRNVITFTAMEIAA